MDIKKAALVRPFLVGLLAAAAFTSNYAAEADQAKSEGCIFDGPNFAWIIPAPDGWTVSCLSDEHPRVPIALWRLGSNWKSAQVMMYVNPTDRGPKQSLEAFANQEVKEFQQRNPTVKVVEGAPIETASDGKALVRHFTGDRWGNVESIAYVDATGPFAVIVLSAKNQVLHDGSYKAFLSLIGGMAFIGDAKK